MHNLLDYKYTEIAGRRSHGSMAARRKKGSDQYRKPSKTVSTQQAGR